MKNLLDNLDSRKELQKAFNLITNDFNLSYVLMEVFIVEWDGNTTNISNQVKELADNFDLRDYVANKFNATLDNFLNDQAKLGKVVSNVAYYIVEYLDNHRELIENHTSLNKLHNQYFEFDDEEIDWQEPSEICLLISKDEDTAGEIEEVVGDFSDYVENVTYREDEDDENVKLTFKYDSNSMTFEDDYPLYQWVEHNLDRNYDFFASDYDVINTLNDLEVYLDNEYIIIDYKPQFFKETESELKELDLAKQLVNIN